MSDTLHLLTLPVVFSQDGLLNPNEFSRRAEALGFPIREQMLEALHRSGHLVPLLIEVDEEDGRYAVKTEKIEYLGSLAIRAAAGAVRDPATQAEISPWRRPADAPQDVAWFSGYHYSVWQLLDLPELAQTIGSLKLADGSLPANIEFTTTAKSDPLSESRRRDRAVALAALATKYLPGVTSQLRLPHPLTASALYALIRDSDPADALGRCGVDPTSLYTTAEKLLFAAHRGDPLEDWLQLMRQMPVTQLDKLRGSALMAVWQRRAAEVLLRAHEAIVGPLLDLSGTMSWHPLAERVTPPPDMRRTLDSTLATFGISPHPRLLILVEGQTEYRHVRQLLELMVVPRHMVRVEHLEGSTNNPQLLARYAIAPQVGPVTRFGKELAVPPTVLWIIADAEGLWAPQKQTVDKIKRKIREQVELQGGTIDSGGLDFLVRPNVAPSGFYEINNFSDDELVTALATLGNRFNSPGAGGPEWEAHARQSLHDAHNHSSAFESKFLRPAPTVEFTKKTLATELWSLLEDDLINNSPPTRSIVQLVIQAVQVAETVPREGIIVFGSDH